MPSVDQFYDGLADDYDLVWGGSWEAVIEEQGAVLDQLIRARAEAAADVLDYACGIGTCGLLIASTRDYDRALVERPVTAQPLVVTDSLSPPAQPDGQACNG